MHRYLALGVQRQLFDWAIIGYSLLVMILILGFGRPIRDYYDELIFLSAALALGWYVPALFPRQRTLLQRAARWLYPAFLFTFFYRSTGGLMFLIHDQFYDARLIAFEQSIFGIEPTRFIDSLLPLPLVTEIVSACYFSYYFMFPALIIPLFTSRRFELLGRFLSAVSIMFFLSYLTFFLWPIEGPRWVFADQYANTVEGYLFRWLVEFVIDTGAVRGGAMPSSHTGAALLVLYYAWKARPSTIWWLTPVVIGLAVGTVWGRFHYVSDVLVGAIYALIGLAAAEQMARHSRREADQRNRTEPARARYAS